MRNKETRPFISAALNNEKKTVCYPLERAFEGNVNVGDTPGIIYVTSQLDERITNTFSSIANAQTILYPYDTFDTYLSMQISYSLRQTTQIVRSIPSSSPFIDFDAAQPNLSWKLTVTQQDIQENEINYVVESTKNTSRFFKSLDRFVQAKQSHITFSRPILYRVSYPIAIFGIILLLGITALVESIDTFLQVSMATLFGIFGLKQLLIPSNIGVPTILENVILMLYVVFAGVVIVFIVGFLVKRHPTKPSAVHLASQQVIDKTRTANIKVSSWRILLIVAGMSAFISWIFSKLEKRK